MPESNRRNGPPKHYSTGNPELDKEIEALVAEVGSMGTEADFLEEIITTAIKLHQDHADRGDVKLVTYALKEMRHSFRVFANYRKVRKISIFGSARTQPESPDYLQCRDFAHAMAELGFMVITGGGPGIMLAGNEGAGRDHSFAVNIRLPFEQSANPVVLGSPTLINFRYFFTRKLAFVKESDAIVLLPGGFGTMDEGFESLTLLQTGKARMMPVVCLDAPGGSFWSSFDRFVREQLLERKLINASDLSLYRVVDTVEAAREEILRFYRRYHSARFVRETLVMRLAPPLPAGLVDSLNAEFSDVLRGPIQGNGPLEAESDDPEIAHLPRLLV
ncbi:MAG: LOG family protein, partial [Candidatus Xenobia bacterium]